MTNRGLRLTCKIGESIYIDHGLIIIQPTQLNSNSVNLNFTSDPAMQDEFCQIQINREKVENSIALENNFANLTEPKVKSDILNRLMASVYKIEALEHEIECLKELVQTLQDNLHDANSREY